MALAPGTRVGNFEVAVLLGSGGMGEVYRARDVRLHRDVALKVLSPALAGDTEAVIRFSREARAASALNHPHILQVYDIGEGVVEGASIHFIAMELVEGWTLREAIHTGGNPVGLLGALAQAADALARAHEAGIVHRDLKPENIMVTRDGYAKVLDFGLAKLASGTGGAMDAASRAGVIVGTVGYMSPEQALGETVDHRSDVFSFGCVLYEALAGRRPFTGASSVDVLYQVIHAAPHPVRAWVPETPEELDAVVMRCLAKGAGARFPSLREVAGALRAVARGDVAPSPHDFPTVQTPKLVPPSEEAATVSIAVLPFDDLSPGRDNEYFSDGLADEVIADLSRVASLRVISRGSVNRFRGSGKSIDEAFAVLGVDYILDGSVRKAGRQLRITAALVERATKAQVWSERYAGTLDDVFEIQEEVSRAIVRELRVKLTPREIARLGHHAISNVQAWECYCRARREILTFTEEAIGRAEAELETALALAPDNVALLAAKGLAAWQYYNAGLRPETRYLDRAEEIARAILEREPGSSHAQRLEGLVCMHRGLHLEAVRHLHAALAVDPSDTVSALFLVTLLAFRGRDDIAEPLAARYVQIDPLGPWAHHALALVAMLQGRWERAIRHHTRAATLHPAHPGFTFFLGVEHFQKGDRSEAVRIFAKACDQEPGGTVGAMSRAYMGAADGDAGAVRAALTPEVEAACRGDLQYASWMAELLALAGATDAALDWLETAIDRGCTCPDFLGVHDALLRRLHGHPRFDELIARARRESAAIDWEGAIPSGSGRSTPPGRGA